MNSETASLELILGEIRYKRERQIAHHGWTPEHDNSHESGELAVAAIPYIQAASTDVIGELTVEELQVFWPFDNVFNPRPDADRRELLLNAAALLVAELERMDRTA